MLRAVTTLPHLKKILQQPETLSRALAGPGKTGHNSTEKNRHSESGIPFYPHQLPHLPPLSCTKNG